MESIQYNVHGAIASENDLVFARQDKSSSTRYFILHDRSTIVDPMGQHSNNRGSYNWELKQVTKDAYESYLKYLQNKKRSSYDNARRNKSNG